MTADRARQAVAVDHLADVAHQQREHFELAPRQRHVRALRVAQPAAGQVQRPAGETENLLVFAAAAPRTRAPQQALDPRQQLARIEGLGDVVVRAHLEADDLVDVVVAAGEQDDADRRVARAQLTRQRQAVLAGQIDVEQHQIDCGVLELLPEGLAVPRQQHAIALLREVGVQARLGDQVVVDDQQAGGVGVGARRHARGCSGMGRHSRV